MGGIVVLLRYGERPSCNYKNASTFGEVAITAVYRQPENPSAPRFLVWFLGSLRSRASTAFGASWVANTGPSQSARVALTSTNSGMGPIAVTPLGGRPERLGGPFTPRAKSLRCRLPEWPPRRPSSSWTSGCLSLETGCDGSAASTR
jgi:hypothetical protein